MNRIFRARKRLYVDPNANRPVKLVPDGYNSWRVVYAD
jgi:hypothetical protein